MSTIYKERLEVIVREGLEILSAQHCSELE